jgi:HEAT repeat protein
LEPLLPIYQRGILYGTASIREASATGLGEVISLTATKFLAGALIIKMTGPLLRIVGDRNPSNVKIAILKCLGLILVKGGAALRAFVPQFQTTFVKALADPSRQVRVEAINALGLLMPLSTRVDPLLKELVAGSLGKSGNADTVGIAAVQAATLEALAVVIKKGGKKAKLPASIPSALKASQELIAHNEETVREAAAKVMGVACEILGKETADNVVRNSILEGDNESGETRHGRACAIRRILTESIGNDLDDSVLAQLRNLTLQFLKDDKPAVKYAGYAAIGAVIARSSDSISAIRGIERDLLVIMGNSKEKVETHQAIGCGLCLALQLSDVENRVDFFGLKMLNTCLRLAMSGAQSVQFAFNDVLFLALNVADGQGGLDYYCSMAMFENAKQMKSIHSKVLLKIKDITILND